jgi:monoamine oxidase
MAERNPLLNRRQILQGLGAGGLAAAFGPPLRAATPVPDVLVVGAGAAGLTAARELAASKIPTIVLEARDRIGGRAFTESSLGTDWDRGASWLRSASVNPWMDYARQNGFDVVPDNDARRVYDGAQRLGEADTAGYRAVRERMQRELGRAGRHGLDIPAEAAFTQVTVADPWYPLAMDDLTARHGVEPSNHSALDAWQYDEGDGADFAVPRGCGTLLAHYAKGIDVRLRTPVTRIRWGGRGVTADTAAGPVSARVAIVALPSALVADGAVLFTPHLPAEVLQAHHDLPLGLVDKVALRFKKNVFPSERTEFLRMKREDGRGLDYLTRHWGSNVCIASAAGRLARDLEAAGETAAVNHAVDELTAMLGGEVRKQFDKGLATAWAADPYARGAWSHTVPGRYGARALLARPVGDRIVFAGEHTGQTAFGTLHGAHLSGKRAAAEARRLLARG